MCEINSSIYQIISLFFIQNTHYDDSFRINTVEHQGIQAKPVIVGPVTYLSIGKAKDGSDKLALLDRLLPAYVELLTVLAEPFISPSILFKVHGVFISFKIN
jgi:hypothetical protein